MRNTVKMIKTILIASCLTIVAACSSGGTGTIEGLNLTGRWVGTIQDTPEVAFDVVFNIAQEETVGITGGTQTSNITYSLTFIRTSDPTGVIQPCLGTLAGETATLTFNSRNPILTGDGFSAFANNSRISGQIVVDEGNAPCGGPLELRRA